MSKKIYNFIKKHKLFLSAGLIIPLCLPTLAVVSCSNVKSQQTISTITNFSDDNYSLIRIQNLSVLPSINVYDYYVKDSNDNNLDIMYNESHIDIESLILKTNLIDTSEINSIKIYCRKNKSFNLTINNFKTFKLNDVNTNKQYFFDLIDNMSKNNIPTIIESRNASLIIQQCFYIVLVNYFNNFNNFNNNDFSVLMTHDDTINSNRFNESVLVENNICSQTTSIDDLNNVAGGGEGTLILSIHMKDLWM